MADKSHLDGKPVVLGLSVDFGMTASGVAVDDGKSIVPVTWPPKEDSGREGNVDKIPTTISYHEDGKIASWGFPPDQNRKGAKYLFKALLDHEVWRSRQETHDGTVEGFDSRHEVRRCVVDYLTMLLGASFRHICDSLEIKSLVIDLTLTRPTTWSRVVVNDYHNLAREAIRKAAQECGAAISIRLNSLRGETESHAAGVYVVETQGAKWKEQGSIFYVLDVGGASIDPALLQMHDDDKGGRRLMPLSDPVVRGKNVGCSTLDDHFSDHVSLLHSAFEEENVEIADAMLSTMLSTARSLRFDRSWTLLRREYSEDTAFSPFAFNIPLGYNSCDQPTTTIILKRENMKALLM